MGFLTALALALPNLLTFAHVPPALKPIYHVGDFLIGLVAARVYSDLLRSRMQGAGYWLYLPAAACGFTIIAFPSIVPHNITLNSALRIFNAMLLAGLALGGGFPVAALSTRLAVFWGRASYAMYILHIPVLWWFKRYFTGVWTLNTSALIYIGCVMAISGYVCERVEEPLNKRIRDWATARLRPASVPSAAA